MSAVSLIRRGNWGGILMAALILCAAISPGFAETFTIRELEIVGTSDDIIAAPTIALKKSASANRYSLLSPTAIDGAGTTLYVAYLLKSFSVVRARVADYCNSPSACTEGEWDSDPNPGPCAYGGEVRVIDNGHASVRYGCDGNYTAGELEPSTMDPGKLSLVPRSASFSAMSDRIAIADDGAMGFCTGAAPFGGFTTLQRCESGTNCTPVLDVTGAFDTLYPPNINNPHDFVFTAFLDDNTTGIYRLSNGTTTAVADSNHGFFAFGDGTINDHGTVALRGIEAPTGKEQIKVFHPGKPELATFAIIGNYSALGDPSINNRDEVLIQAYVVSSGGNSQNLQLGVFGIFPSEVGGTLRTKSEAATELPSPTPVVVVKTGDALSGSTVTDLNMSMQALSDNGDVVFHAKLADNREGVYLATPKRSALLNIATRMKVLTGENVLIGGFIVTGSGSKKVIIRGIGPALSSQGVSGALSDPVIELHQGNATLATNDNWKIRASDGGSQQAEIEATTIPPTNDAESALVATLAPGSYTAILSGKSGGTGVGLIEVYDLDQTSGAQAVNISTRGFVNTGENVMIGGVIAGPADALNSRILIRALGPSLGGSGVGNALANPFLELHDASGGTLFTNDDWKKRPDGSSQQAEIEATTIPPTNDLESAMVGALPPGNYTAIVRGTGNSSGVGLVEVYNLK